MYTHDTTIFGDFEEVNTKDYYIKLKHVLLHKYDVSSWSTVTAKV